MIIRQVATFAALLFATANSGPAADAPKDEVSLQDLPDPWLWAFRPDKLPRYTVDPYLQVASRLQALGKDKAVEMLRDCSKKDNNRTYVLCRMLFAPKPKSTFRRPLYGAPYFLGGSILESWDREPIEIVDGVPFLIVQGYMLGGKPEPGEKYLGYCVKECNWNPEKFTVKTAEQKNKALEKLLASRKFKKPLDNDEKEFLTLQIEPIRSTDDKTRK